MHRRDALRMVGIAGALGIAGCITGDGPLAPGENGGTPSPNGTDGPDAPNGTDDGSSPTETPAGPSVADRSFDVTDRGPGGGENSATVSFDDDDVTVDGTISGQETCDTAELESATYDQSSDSLTVAVRSYRPEDAEACGQSLVAIEYLATVTFDGGLPGEVVVEHNGEQVTTHGRSGTTDTDGADDADT